MTTPKPDAKKGEGVLSDDDVREIKNLGAVFTELRRCSAADAEQVFDLCDSHETLRAQLAAAEARAEKAEDECPDCGEPHFHHQCEPYTGALVCSAPTYKELAAIHKARVDELVAALREMTDEAWRLTQGVQTRSAPGFPPLMPTSIKAAKALLARIDDSEVK